MLLSLAMLLVALKAICRAISLPILGILLTMIKYA
jgi:hypothetical protein